VEEARDPARDIPRAIFWGLAITMILYVLVSLAITALAPSGVLASSEAPLAVAVQQVWPQAAPVLSAIALFATANTALISLIAASRLAMSMSRDTEIPGVFSRLLPGRRTPWAAALLTLVLSAILLPIGDLAALAALCSFSALLAFFAVNVTLIILRYRDPNRPRPFRVPLSIGRMPILPLAAIASILLLIVHFEYEVYLGGAVAIAVCAITFLFRPFWMRTETAAARDL
jgi:APA family basic amino acid/polyamine antiporter